jgi:uncharacterized small protein (DUF1192 family)
MKLPNNQLTLAKARLEQYKASELFSEIERQQKIKTLEIEIARLEAQEINNTDVINPEIVS